MSSTVDSQFTFPNNQPVVSLDCQQAFQELTYKEKLYAHYLSKSSWYGGLIVLVQTSPESPLIFSLLHRLFLGSPVSDLKKVAIEHCGFTEDEFKALLVYASGIYTNMGNYKGFGNSKFVPNLSKNKLESLIFASAAYKQDEERISSLWKKCADAMFNVNGNVKQIGLGNKGITTYFSCNCNVEDSDVINKFFKEKGIESYNTRLFKTTSSGATKYEIRLASVLTTEELERQDLLGTFEYNGCVINITRGDYNELMAYVTKYLEKAKENSANENEVNMIEQYINSFHTGSLPAHKEGSRYWIKNKSPVIETYIGFIETYKDPCGSRGEFEGFVAMVNKPMSVKFSELVTKAEQFIPCLPWPTAYEKDTFLQPDFTSLDVLTFSGSGIPSGINIPNYDEIRQSEGFKNVSLGNVILASFKEVNVPFLSSEDQELLQKYRVGAFEVQVALHELLGHGSGKLFIKNKDGTFNFDIETVKNPLTNEKVSSYYEEGDTYVSKFTSIGSAYEECRAECVGLYLCLNRDILKIFGYTDEEDVGNVIYVNWLNLLWAGLRGLEMYQPDNEQWGQAHSQARYVILQVLLEASKELCTIEEILGTDGEPDLLFKLDRKSIETVGKEAIENFLRKLQVYKSTGDIESATAMFNKYSEVSDTSESAVPFLHYRDIVVARRQPRKMFVQVNTELTETDVILKTYEPSHEQLIQSWLDRFPGTDVLNMLENIFEKDKPHFKV